MCRHPKTVKAMDDVLPIPLNVQAKIWIGATILCCRCHKLPETMQQGPDRGAML